MGEVLIIAYALTGIRKVVKAFRLDFHNQPQYVRRSNYGAMLLLVLAWAPFDAGMLLKGHWRDPVMRREAISNLATFAVLATLGIVLL